MRFALLPLVAFLLSACFTLADSGQKGPAGGGHHAALGDAAWSTRGGSAGVNAADGSAPDAGSVGVPVASLGYGLVAFHQSNTALVSSVTLGAGAVDCYER